MTIRYGYRFWNVQADPIYGYVLCSPLLNTIWHPDGVGFESSITGQSKITPDGGVWADPSVGFSAYIDMESLLKDYYVSEWATVLGIVSCYGETLVKDKVIYSQKMHPVFLFATDAEKIRILPAFPDDHMATAIEVSFPQILSDLADVYSVDILDINKFS